MTRRTRLHQAILPAVMLTLLVPLLSWTPSAQASVEPINDGAVLFFTSTNAVAGPRIKQLSDADLAAWVVNGEETNITGLETLFLEARYGVPEPVPLDSLGAEANLYYTLDGSPPTKAGPNKTMENVDPTVTAATYRASFLSASLAGATRLRFMIELEDASNMATACDFGNPPDDTGVRMSQSACPATAPFGSGFRATIDRSSPRLELENLNPHFFPDIWSAGAAVTSNDSFQLAFNVTDSDVVSATSQNTRINRSSIAITATFFIPNQARNVTIQLFNQTVTPNGHGVLGQRLNVSLTNDGFGFNATWNRALPFFSNGNASVWWQENSTTDCTVASPPAECHEKWGTNANHTLNIAVRDWAGNDLSTGANKRRFQVDTLVPAVAIDPLYTRAVPSQQGQDERGNDIIVVGVGSQVRMQVNVTDWTMNISRSNTTAVQVWLENASKGLRTPAGFLTYNATAGEGTKRGVLSVPTRNQYLGVLNITNLFNISSPNTPAALTQNITLRYNFSIVDSAGNRLSEVTPTQFTMRPGLPEVTLLPVPGSVSVATPAGAKDFVAAGPYDVTATAFDAVEGVASAKLTIQNVTGTGKFLDLSGWTRVNDNTFERSMARVGSTNNWTQKIPAAEHGTTILYNASAQDIIGNVGRAATKQIIVDTQAPVFQEATNQSWRGPSPHNLTFGILDNQSQPNATSGVIFYRVGTSGTFSDSPMGYNGSFGAGLFTASLAVTVAHLDTVQYHAEATDNMANKATNGTAEAPRSYRIDLVKPVASLNATPATTDTGVFRLAGLGTDADSGVRSFIFEGQFRSPGATVFSGWIQIQTVTLPVAAASRSFTSDELCLVGGGVTYQFRAVAIDDAGNRADPSSAQTTDIPGVGCANELVLTIQQPSAGSLVDAQGGEGTKVIAYTATATGSFISDSLILVKIEFSPDNGQHYVTLADRRPNTGQYEWTVNAPTCTQCRIRLTGTLPDGTSETIESAAFEITDGNRLVDFDGNGMGDSCELDAFGALGVADPKADPDGDGLTNQQECAYGTGPLDADSDDDGAEDGVEIDLGTNPLDDQSKPSTQAMRYTQWADYVWIVPALFALVTIVFLVGLARRW